MTLDYYNNYSDDFYASTVNVDMEHIYQKFLPHISGTGIIIDAGCGSGRDAHYFKSKGFNVAAFDASEKLAIKAQNLLNQRVEVTTFEKFNMPFLASGIWCCASLLHVTKSNLLTSISNLDNHLQDGGVMYVSFKYGNTERISQGRRFTDMTEQCLTQLLAPLVHLSIVELWVTADNRPGRDNEKWLNAIIKKSTVAARSQSSNA